MDEAPHESGGLLARGKRILRTLADLAQTRVELFLVELQEEHVRLFDALLLVVVSGVCGLLALGLLTFTLVVIFWEDHRILVLIVLTLGYATGAGISFWNLRKRLRRWHAFSATLDQIKKDRACFEKQS
jgi:uncharacterized membrane protein YqjE